MRNSARAWLRVVTVVAIAMTVGGMSASRCRPVPAPNIPACKTADGAYTQRTRLAAMLSIHAYAYWRPLMKPNGLGPENLKVQPFREAIRTLRCDPEPLAVSRRRRAIAKLLAYDWPGEHYRAALEALGADVDAIVAAVTAAIGQAQLHQYVLHSRLQLETLILRVTAVQAFLITTFPAAANAVTTATPTVTPIVPSPTPTRTPTPHFVAPLVTATPTNSPTRTPTPVSTVIACAQGWMPEMTHLTYVDSGAVHSYAYISVPGRRRDDVARSVDPQSWDQCSKFWPNPATGPLYDSAALASLSLAGKCKLTSSQVALQFATPGVPYGTRNFYEDFRCKTPPCDSEFWNVLQVTTSYDPPGSDPAHTYRVEYGLPVCAQDNFDGPIDGEVQGQPVVPVEDHGTIDVWNDQNGARVRANKTVAFTNGTYTYTYGAILEFAELNEELAEIVCCEVPP